MQTGAAANFSSLEKRSEKRLDDSETRPSEKILELRQKIRSGFYESKEVIIQIVNKLLSDLKQPKE